MLFVGLTVQTCVMHYPPRSIAAVEQQSLVHVLSLQADTVSCLNIYIYPESGVMKA